MQTHTWQVKLSQAFWDWAFRQIKVEGRDKQVELNRGAVKHSSRHTYIHIELRVRRRTCTRVHTRTDATTKQMAPLLHKAHQRWGWLRQIKGRWMLAHACTHSYTGVPAGDGHDWFIDRSVAASQLLETSYLQLVCGLQCTNTAGSRQRWTGDRGENSAEINIESVW